MALEISARVRGFPWGGNVNCRLRIESLIGTEFMVESRACGGETGGQGNRMNEDRERGLGSHRPSGAGHVGRDVFPGVPLRQAQGSHGLFSRAPSGSHPNSRPLIPGANDL